jgi:hypothetical protein
MSITANTGIVGIVFFPQKETVKTKLVQIVSM